MSKILIDVCLSDIPAGRRKTARNGKVYTKLEIGELREPDDKGNDHFVRCYTPVDERENSRPVYVGRGKTMTPRQGGSQGYNAPRGGGYSGGTTNGDLDF